MNLDDRARGEWVLGLVEDEIYRLGGDELLDDARVEARWYADLFHPWSGRGNEPLDRLVARIEILSRRHDRSGGVIAVEQRARRVEPHADRKPVARCWNRRRRARPTARGCGSRRPR